MRNRAIHFMFIAIVLFSLFVVARSSLLPVSAQGAFDFTIGLNGYSLTISPNHSGYVQVTVSVVSGPGSPQNVSLAAGVTPQDGLLSMSFAQSTGIPPFVTTLIVNVLNALPGKQYTITVSGTSQGLVRDAPPLIVTIGCSEGTCATLTIATVGDGTVNPSCPSGCSEPVGQAMQVTAIPDPSWTFSGWNVTGAACSGGADASPCTFTMPNGPVSITANFVRYEQTLYTGYAGEGHISPSCPGGCQIEIGSSVSIVVTPASGWTVSGYQLTSGVSCTSQFQYICSFAMPNFPVTFQVTFTETTVTTRSIAVVSSTIQTSVTTTVVVGSLTTSTVTTSTVSLVQTGTTQTSTLYSTSGAYAMQTQSVLATSFLTTSISETSATMALQDPTLELTVAGIILLSAVMIGVAVVRRSPRRGSVDCARCGTKNPAGLKFCVNCGEALKGPRTK